MTTFRSDGLDSPISPNGAHPLYYVIEDDGARHGPYSCPREAELATQTETATIVDHRGGVTYLLTPDGRTSPR